MSRINDLIQELCPDGVRYVALSDCTEYSSTRISASRLDESSFVGVDNLLPNKAGKTEAKHLPNTQRLTRFTTNDLLIGNIRPYLKKIWLADRTGGCSGDVLAIHIKENFTKLLQPQFLYYLLSSDHFFLFDQQHAKGGKMPRGSKQQVMKYRIPIPPLEVQEEIVRILDSLTSLEAELEAELEARQEQYSYYRNDIISKCTSSCIRMPLSDIGMLIRGHGMTKSDFTDKGIGAIHYGQLYTTFDTATDSVMSYVSPAIAQSLLTVNPGNLIISNTSENLDDVGKAVAWLGDNQIVTGGHATVLRHNQNPKYLAYWFQTPDFQLQKRKYAAGTKVIELPAKALEKIVIPLPSLSDQSRIVSELDKFRLLNVSMSSGLPAEIETRHKQYEYYRDRLLTFKEQDHE